MKPAASLDALAAVDKAGLDLCGPAADCSILALQCDRAYQASEGE
jgi:hypothetical protein